MYEETYFQTPILFLIFNRPSETLKVFDIICKIKPAQLYIAADGPRIDRIGEFEICNQTRNLILNNVFWPCEIKTLFRDKNLGCGIAVSEGITWFFNNVDKGIILEDDTIPDLSFFPYCEYLLNIYKDDKNIMHISGNSFNTFKSDVTTSNSIYFSKFPFNWGWASWKRAWDKYDYSIIINTNSNDWVLWLNNNFKEKIIIDYWNRTLKNTLLQKKSFTWDYQWYLTIWKNNGISILPQRNLVKNIGWILNATHTNEPNHHLGKLKIHKIKFPLKIPKSYNLNNYIFDLNNFHNYYTVPKSSLFYLIYRGKIIKKTLSKLKFLILKIVKITFNK